MANDSGVVVVPDLGSRAGAMTWWRLSGVLDYDTLKQKWSEADLPPNELPALPSEHTALRRALANHRRGPRTLLRSLPGGGFAVVDEEFDADYNVEDEDPEYSVRFKVWLDMDELAMKFDRNMPEQEGRAITSAYVRARRELHATDLSAWLVRRVTALNAVGLRDTGGIYYVPENAAARWSALADLLKAISTSRIFEVPALRTDRAVEAIMDAVLTETTEGLQTITQALDARADEMTARGLRGKIGACEKLAQKLALYEHLLGARQQAMASQIQEVRARAVELMMLAEETV